MNVSKKPLKIKQPTSYYVKRGLLGLVVFFILMQIIPPGAVEEQENPFLANPDIQIIAHRGGRGHNPEETMKALKEAGDLYHADTLEFDLQLTKDNRLVLIHDDTINDTGILAGSSDYETPLYVHDLTLTELEKYNFGVNFQSDNGTFPYRDLTYYQFHSLGLDIVTVDEVFDYFENVQTKKVFTYVIEIKNEGTLGLQAADLLVSLLKSNDLLERTIVASFHGEVGDYLSSRYPEVMRSAYYDEIFSFLVLTYLGLDALLLPKAIAFQLPTSQKLAGVSIDLTTPFFIYRAHRHQMSLQYWTVNDEATMRELVAKGVDGIMTDYPQVLYEVLVEMGRR